MAKSNDTVKKRLAELFSSGLGAEVSARVKEVEKEIGLDANIVPADWVDPTMVALTLNPSSVFDQAAITAFNKAGLDSKDPIHWRLLMILFSWAHFGKWPGPGRPPKWTGKRYSQLLHDFSTIRNEKSTIPDIEVCRILKKRHREKYDKSSADRLAKEVKRAQNPKFNPLLTQFLEIMLIGAKMDHRRKNIPWNPDVEAEKTRRYLELILKVSGPKKRVKASVSPASIEK